MHTCFQRQNDISGRNGILHRIADSGSPQSFGVLILIHASISTQIDIFTMVKKRHATFCPRSSLLLYKVLYSSQIFHPRILGSLLSPFRQYLQVQYLFSHGRTCLKYMNTGNLRLVMYIVYPVRIINSGSCIWHSTVVTPPRAAAARPLLISSLCVWPDHENGHEGR